MIYYFYKIVCDDLPNFVYVGSTMSFANRKYQHKGNCSNENRKHYNLKIYQTIRENGGWNNWRMVCIHQQEVDNKRHAEKIEEDYRVELNANMNCIRAFTTPEQRKEDKKEYHKEWRENNKDYLSEKKKEYYEHNKDYLNEKNKEHAKEYYENNRDQINQKRGEVIICECGCEIRRDSLSRHKRTKKHIKLIQNI